MLFESLDPKAASMRDLSLHRLQFVLRRRHGLVSRARLRLSDINGPRGGVDKRCQIELATAGAGTLVISATTRDWRSAIDSALARANRQLLRQGLREQLIVSARLVPAVLRGPARLDNEAVNALLVRRPLAAAQHRDRGRPQYRAWLNQWYQVYSITFIANTSHVH